MDAEPKYDLPWDLIAAALLDDSSPEEAAELQLWLSNSEENRSAYQQILETWEDGVEDYQEYVDFDTQKSWKALQQRLGGGAADLKPETAVVKGRFSLIAKRMNRWVAVAATLLLVLGIAFWQYRERTGQLSYETGAGQELKLALSDGSSIYMKPLTRLTVPRSFNRQTRTVSLDKGEAFFDVRHGQRPFIVDMGASSVRDIGTRFTIRKGKDSITVTVSSGKVAFIKNATSESRQLTGGMTLSLSVPGESFGAAALAGPGSGLQKDSLRFNGASLQEVIRTVEQFYGKNVEVKDSSLLQEKLTADLSGLSFEEAMKIISNSLNLRYSEKNGTSFLESRQ